MGWRFTVASLVSDPELRLAGHRPERSRAKRVFQGSIWSGDFIQTQSLYSLSTWSQRKSFCRRNPVRCYALLDWTCVQRRAQDKDCLIRNGSTCLSTSITRMARFRFFWMETSRQLRVLLPVRSHRRFPGQDWFLGQGTIPSSLDEVRLANQSRSADWVLASTRIKSPSLFSHPLPP